MAIGPGPNVPGPQGEQTGEDQTAIDEGISIAVGKDLERLADENQHSRREIIRDVIAKWLGYGIQCASIVFLFGMFVWAWHVFGINQLPLQSGGVLHLKWLTKPEISEIQKALTQVGLGTIFGFLIKSKFL